MAKVVPCTAPRDAAINLIAILSEDRGLIDPYLITPADPL